LKDQAGFYLELLAAVGGIHDNHVSKVLQQALQTMDFQI